MGSSPAATMNTKKGHWEDPPQEGGPMVQQDLSRRPAMKSRARPVEKKGEKGEKKGKKEEDIHQRRLLKAAEVGG